MSRIAIDVGYFDWLCDLVQAEKHEHYDLLETLQRKEFYWSVPNDDNRAKDGLELRSFYPFEEDYEFLGAPCTVLEMLVALADRFDDLMPDPTTVAEELERPAWWFWEMIENAGLYKYTDERLHDGDHRLELDHILNRILSREYKKNGRGGFFPLKNPEKNQQKVEIWYQMNEYIMEKTMDKFING